jgi:uncharacterized protein (TIGR02391 family)
MRGGGKDSSARPQLLGREYLIGSPTNPHDVPSTSSRSRAPLVRVLLEDYHYDNEVSDFLQELGESIVGSKEVRIRRLLDNHYFDRTQVLSGLDRAQIAELCRQRGLDDSGTFRMLKGRLAGLLSEEQRQALNRVGREPIDPFGRWALLIHPRVKSVAQSPFLSGNRADAVFNAMKAVNIRVRDFVRAKTQKNLDGVNLMNQAFSPNGPIITLADLKSESGEDEQRGYMLLFGGSMLAIRNPKAHDFVELDEQRALHHLILASLLMHKLDEAGLPD